MILHPSRVEIGARLQAERKRIGLNQDEFAQHLGVAKRTIAGYEGGGGDIGASVLAVAAELGVDVLYVITGRRTPAELDAFGQAELDVLGYMLAMDAEDKAAYIRMGRGFLEAAEARRTSK
ncbi:XRE family transcriptional regulator [Pseudomonas aeruginosa]|nr:XRE family transcriptional regulator [Pseudomonas aeruginosa]